MNFVEVKTADGEVRWLQVLRESTTEEDDGSITPTWVTSFGMWRKVNWDTCEVLA